MTKIYSLIAFILFSLPQMLSAQKDQIPLEIQLEQNSERQLIKIGMINASKPAKLKFGTYSTDDRKGQSMTEGGNSTKLLFSFNVNNSQGDVAKVEASAGKDSKDQNDTSVYISTNLDQEDLWVLLVGTSPESTDLSVHNIFLTNGDKEITFKNVIGFPTNKSELTAPKGIEVFIDDYPIAAMQYYSGGSFSYKKFIWISEESEPQLQLVMAAVFSSLLEIGDYFDGNGFTD